VSDVRRSSEDQAQGVGQVATAISRMEKVTPSTAATAEESAAASEELNAQAEASLPMVLRLERIVGASTAAGSTITVTRGGPDVAQPWQRTGTEG
jgi:methyl-accepting chemotaxis protein